MSSIREVFLETMDELLEEELERFKLYLTRTMEQGFDTIPRVKLEKANHRIVFQLMMDHYGETDAVKNTVWILNQIKRKPLASELEKKVEKLKGGVPGGQVQAGDSSQVSSSSSQSPDVSLQISGSGNVHAPVLSGGTYNGPVTINISSTGK